MAHGDGAGVAVEADHDGVQTGAQGRSGNRFLRAQPARVVETHVGFERTDEADVTRIGEVGLVDGDGAERAVVDGDLGGRMQVGIQHLKGHQRTEGRRLQVALPSASGLDPGGELGHPEIE